MSDESSAQAVTDRPFRLPLATPASAFLVLGALLGLVFLVVTPPFQVPDEYQHFYRAFQVAEGTLLPQRLDSRGDGWLPASLPAVVARLGVDSIRFQRDVRQRPEDMAAALAMPLEPTQRQLVPFPYTARYAPIAYGPQALGIAVGRGLGLGPAWLLYVGRLTTLACWLALGYWALRLTPTSEWGLFLLLLMPMSLFEAASVSADAPTNGLAVLLIAWSARVALVETGPLGPAASAGLWP